jgi:hypothetical protein
MQLRFLFLLMLLLLPLNMPNAQVIQQLQPLSFGTIAIVNNSQAGTLTIDRFGNVTSNTNFRIVLPPQEAVFQLYNLAPNTGVSITLSHSSNQLRPVGTSGEYLEFTLTDYSRYLVVERDGTVEFRVGGTVSTTGSGSLNYAQAEHSIVYRINLLY